MNKIINRKTMFAMALAILLMGAGFLVTSNATFGASMTRPSMFVAQAQPAAASTASVKVIGTFVAPNQATLTFKSSGRLNQINVTEGASVKKGDVLATLETTELDLNVTQVLAALALAQARLAQTKAGGISADLDAAKAALDAAQANYARVTAGPTRDDLAAAKSNLDRAQAAVSQAQAAYDRVGGPTNPFAAMLPTTLALQQATSSYQGALAAYNLAKNHPTPAELTAAAAQVAQAEDALARLQPTTENLAIAQAQVDQAQAALDLAKQQVANATLNAPTDGTVLWIGPHVGESISPATPFLSLGDLTHLQLQVGVDESVLALIKVGQKVSIVPEAFKDKTLKGTVTRIGLIATTAGGVINVPITIDLDASDASLRPGLSATAEIQTK